MESKWKYCPECGCEEILNENLVGPGFRNCKNCFQEWWADVDYTDTIKLNLQSFKAAQSKGGWTDEHITNAFKAGVEFTQDMVRNPNVDEYLKQLKLK